MCARGCGIFYIGEVFGFYRIITNHIEIRTCGRERGMLDYIVGSGEKYYVGHI
jgi:hypothetical protein